MYEPLLNFVDSFLLALFDVTDDNDGGGGGGGDKVDTFGADVNSVDCETFNAEGLISPNGNEVDDLGGDDDSFKLSVHNLITFP